MPLWKLWWLWGLPVIGLVIGLSEFAERSWVAGRPELAAFAEALRFCLYWSWCWLTWRAASNVRRSLWTPVARAALAAGLVTVVLT